MDWFAIAFLGWMKFFRASIVYRLYAVWRIAREFKATIKVAMHQQSICCEPGPLPFIAYEAALKQILIELSCLTATEGVLQQLFVEVVFISI